MREKWGDGGGGTGRQEGGAGKGKMPGACTNEKEEEGRKRPVTASFQGSLSYMPMGKVEGSA